VGPPEELYERPATRFVATFVGRASALPGLLTRDATGAAAVALDGTGSPPVAWPAEPAPGLEGVPEGTPVELVARPESLRLAGEGEAGAQPGRVVDRRYAGALTYYTVALAAGPEVEVLAPASVSRPGETVHVAPGEAGPRPRIFRGGEG